MAQQKGRQHGFDALRRRAEKMERELRGDGEDLSAGDSVNVAELLHELRVHQIELELQNEELREAQLALTEARDKFSDLYEFAPVGYLTLDGDGKIISANLTAATMFGADRPSVIGKPFADFVERESQDALHRHLRSVAVSHLKQSVDLTIRHSSGLLPHFRVDSIAESIDDVVGGCRCTLTDITELHLAQQALKSLNETLEAQVTARTHEAESANASLQEEARRLDMSDSALAVEKEFNEALINTAQTIILVLDKQGLIVSYNRYLEELSGYKLAEMRGKSWMETFIREQDRDWLNGMFRRAVAGTRTRGNTNSIVTRSGEERYIEWYDTELATADGKFTGLLCTGQDVTERRTLHEQLLGIAEREQHRIGQQLHDDIGQELAALRLTMDTLVDGLQAEQSAELDKGIRITRGLVSSLRKLRALSRGLIGVRVGAADFDTELRALCDQFAAVHCECTCAPDVILRDDEIANQLYYIAREALTNAAKHGGVENLSIDARLELVDDNVVLTVSDNGVGISDQSNHTRGSGMHLMRYRAELIGATLSISAGAQGGTIVTCTVPHAARRRR